VIGRELMPWLPAAIMATTLVTIAADHLRAVRTFRCFKPATTLLIILLAYLQWPGERLLYREAILLGLVFSLVGDIVLMLAARYFVLGLGSFLLAHCCYIWAFRSVAQSLPWGVPAAAMCMAIAALLVITLPRCGKLVFPVLIYGLVILCMLLSALALWQEGGPGSALAFYGALLFVGSDAVLALNKFVKPLPAAQALILGSYFPAQLLIACSIAA